MENQNKMQYKCNETTLTCGKVKSFKYLKTYVLTTVLTKVLQLYVKKSNSLKPHSLQC